MVDTLFELNIPTANLSFNQATKLVLAAFLEAHRQSGRIPRRSGFEYSELLRPFTEQSFGSRSSKLRLANMLAQPPSETAAVPVSTVAEIADPDKRKRRILYEELLARKNSGDGWTNEDQAMFAPLLEEFYT